MLLNKNTLVNIVVSETPAKAERFAAEELCNYIAKILDVKPTVSHCVVENECNFIVGPPMRNEAAAAVISEQEFSRLVTGPEGMFIAAKGNCVVFAGSVDGDGYDRGNLYAVYEFLERYMGCCFGAYSGVEVNAGEVVPHYTEFSVEAFEYVKAKADLTYRTAILQYNFWVGNADHKLNPAFIDWLAKNRYNRILTWVGIYEQYCELGVIPELEKRGIRLSVGHHHALFTWLPPFGNARFPIAYAKEHLDFFRLQQDGTRYIPKGADNYEGQLILCNRNEQAIAEISENIIAWAKENPLVDTIALWPNDGKELQCCCDACVKYTKTENYLYFANAVAKRVRATLPYIKIDVLIYNDLWECPDDLQLCDGIVIDESTWADEGLRTCGKPDGSCLVDTSYESNLLQYKKVAKNLVLYEYYMGNYGNRQRIMPAADELQSIYTRFAAVGISGSGTQIECFNVWNNLLNFYCFARTAYDTTLSLSRQIKCITKLFGRGGVHIAEILERYEKTLDGQVPINETGDWFAAHIDKDAIYALFEKALKAAESVLYRNNIRLLRMAFRYTMLSSIGEEQIQQAEKTELSYMYTHFNSYLVDGGYAIAIPNQEKTDAVLEDIWYMFE